MNIKKLPPFELGDTVLITWDDAFVLAGHYWRDLDEIYETDHERTVGFYLQATDRFVTVAQTVGRGGDDEEDQWGGVYSVPVGFIISIDKL